MPSVLTQLKAATYSDKAALKVLRELRNGVSDTEWTALVNGTVGFEGSIFAGKPDWDNLLNTPAPSLTEEEQSFLDREVEEFCGMVDEWTVREELHDLPPEAHQYLKDKGFYGLIIPKEYGGKGFSAQAHSAIVAKINSRTPTGAVTAMVPNSLGPAELLMNYGTESQKDQWLPRLASGDEIPCFALTSETAGSDATSMTDEGVLYKQDDGSLGLRLNWAKRYITLAPIASLFGVAYKMKVPGELLEELRDNPEASFKDQLLEVLGEPYDGLQGEELSRALDGYLASHTEMDLGITLSLVPADTPGIERGLRHRPGGSAFFNGPNWGKNVEVSLDTIIGGAKEAGNGWSMLTDCLSVGRSISLPATATGGMKYLTRVTGAYAGVRNQFGYADENGQFGMPLAVMEGVQEYLSRMATSTYILDSARILPLQELDIAHENGEKARPAIPSAILKYNATNMMAQAAADSMGVHAGKGVVEGPNNPVAHAYQGAPVGQTVEGANSLTRTMITFGQAGFLIHPYVMDQMAAAESGDKKLAGKLLRKHGNHFFGRGALSLAFNLGASGLISSPRKGPDARYYKQISRLSTNFATIGNGVMLGLQKGLKSKQRISGRLADSLSNLYMASQVLRRWDLDGRRQEDQPLMELACQELLYEAEQSMYDALENMPNKLPAKMFTAFAKATVFPRGPRLKKPSDRLRNKVAQLMATPGGVRDRLTAGIYMPEGGKEYLTRLENAFSLAHKSMGYEVALAKGLKKEILTPTTDKESLLGEAVEKGLLPEDTDVPAVAQLLGDTEEARKDIIAVDAFPFEWKGRPVNPTGYPQLPN